MSDAFRDAFQTVGRHLDEFQHYLPVLSQLNAKDPMLRTMLLTHTIIDAATIQLYRIFFYVDSVARQHCLMAAHNMVACGGLDLREFGCMNPIMGVSVINYV